MHFEARIEPLTGKLPKVSYRWTRRPTSSQSPVRNGESDGAQRTVDLEGGDGSFVVIDVAGAASTAWTSSPGRTTSAHATTSPSRSRPRRRVVFRAGSRSRGWRRSSGHRTHRGEEPTESVLHIRVGRQRVASVVRVADLLLVEVDKNSRLAGLWFLDVPPFPNVEATA